MNLYYATLGSRHLHATLAMLKLLNRSLDDTLQKTPATSNQPEVAQGADYRRTTYPQFSSWNRKPPGAKLT